MSVRISLIAFGLITLLTGCETIEGFGRDVSNTANAVQRALN
ncbi:entericidin A/B family lipoprotein [Litoreibacter janthinus]|uniref:Entericidin EcnA/B family protein n=1 Tax=Litoreibacter janthinus TaxID=670154 RepID=A0A1I6HP08_9RHOB|nr:entericidin A/B family lipoprotein [Litoreibacter janthinus]SFR56185.1 Entericidin EcnA/B family protein [Litoreibacter janthinus]